MLVSLFGLAAATAPIQYLDELILGEWTIQANDFFTESAEKVNVSYYSTVINETSDEGVFLGKIFFRNETAEPEFVDDVQFCFDLITKSHVTVSMGADSLSEAAHLEITESRLGFRSAEGNLSLPGLSFSLSILSFKAIELIVMNEGESKVTMFRMFKAVDVPSGSGFGSLMQLLPLALIVFFLFGRKKG